MEWKCPNDTDGDGDCHKCFRRGGCAAYQSAENAELLARIAQLEKQLSDEQQWRVDAQLLGDKLQAEVGELKGLCSRVVGCEEMLRLVRRQLHQWADESCTGGWSTHQVQTQRNLAAAIQQFLDNQD